MDFKKFENLITISLLGIFAGIILLFINFLIGISVLLFSIIYFYQLINKNPESHKEWLAKNATEQKRAQQINGEKQKIIGREFSIIHIQGINFINNNQEIYCVLHDNVINFTDKKRVNLKDLNYADIKNITILEELQQIRKNKSVIGRAIVGGLLLGPVAAVVGGISGACPSFKTNKKYYLEISLLENYYDNIVITANNKVLKDLKKIIADKMLMSGGNN